MSSSPELRKQLQDLGPRTSLQSLQALFTLELSKMSALGHRSFGTKGNRQMHGLGASMGPTSQTSESHKIPQPEHTVRAEDETLTPELRHYPKNRELCGFWGLQALKFTRFEMLLVLQVPSKPRHGEVSARRPETSWQIPSRAHQGRRCGSGNLGRFERVVL